MEPGVDALHGLMGYTCVYTSWCTSDSCLSFTLTASTQVSNLWNLKFYLTQNSPHTQRRILHASEWFMFLLFMFTLLEDDASFASSSSSSSTPTAFGTGLPLMFNSCHVTRLRRTLHPASSCSAVVQLRRVGRCHELSKNPASRESWEGRNFRGDPKKREKKAEGS